MRYFFVFIIMLAFWVIAGCGKADDQVAPGASLNVMTFNIRYDNPDDGENNWKHRKEMVGGIIRFHEIDIVGVQEALHHQMMDLQSELPGYAWVGKGRDDGKEAGEYAAVFYRKDHFKSLDSGEFWLSENPDTPGEMGWDAACPRICTWVRLEDITNGNTFTFFNTHFDHVGKTARRESVRLIKQRIRSLAGGLPVIMTGDLNFSERDSAYAGLVEGDLLKDAFYASQSGHFGPEGTSTGFKLDREGRRIDYILTSDGFDVLRHGVLSYRWHKRYPSDHFPVMAELMYTSQK